MQTKQTLGLALLALATAACSTTETRTFAATNRFEFQVPDDGRELAAWIALPDRNDELQDVRKLEWKLDAPPELATELREVEDARGNHFLHLTATNAGGASFTLETTFTVRRRPAAVSVDPQRTRALRDNERAELAEYLRAGTNIVITPAIRADAERVVGGETNPIRQGRLLYDWTLEHVQYWVKDPTRWKSSGVGSSTYTHEQCTGNCTDFHSLYTAAARAVGLPARMVYGSFFKGPLDREDQDQSYHCWVEFWAPEIGWVPIDVAVADVFVDDFELTEASTRGVELTVADGYHGPDAGLVDFYFGNLDARRVTWNRGRDLELTPPAAAGAINALPKAHVEVDGAPLSEKAGWTRKLTFAELR